MISPAQLFRQLKTANPSIRILPLFDKYIIKSLVQYLLALKYRNAIS